MRHGKQIISLITLFFALLFSNGVDARLDNPSAISVEVAVEETSPDEYWIFVSLKNTASTKITMYASNLPWGGTANRHFVLLAATAGGIDLKKKYSWDSPYPDILELHAGEIVRGKFLLNQIFPELSEVIKQVDVNLFWSYRLPLLDVKDPLRFEELGPVGGWLSLQSKKPKLSPPPVGK
jgi:hypothetical protein